ncbi:MAG: LPS export ABC transporter periplasmic protein LptC [Bacteroidota bacterium]|nr:LPS export ABC transporter periplasmic protein LptC [Bacteroidota bacterium]
MMTNKNAHNIIIVAIVALVVTMFSCAENDIKQVNKITKIDTSPSQLAITLKVNYTENGKLVYTMQSPEMRKFDQPEQKTEFPKGFMAVFYDSLQHQKGNARANYALSHDATGIIELKGNVIIVNQEAKIRIETEKMFWDRNRKMVYGDVAVRVVTPEKIVNAGGFNASEDLSRYNIIHPAGTFYVKEF